MSSKTQPKNNNLKVLKNKLTNTGENRRKKCKIKKSRFKHTKNSKTKIKEIKKIKYFKKAK